MSQPISVQDSSVWQVCFILYAIRTRHLQKIIKIRGKNLFI